MSAMEFTNVDAKVSLAEIPTIPPTGVKKEEIEAEFQQFGQELFELQDLLFASRANSVLIVLQGRDTAGKDGTVKHVTSFLIPRGVQVVSFGIPTEEEQQHDFLWRVHKHAPRHGEIAIFNRSHYEDVLVPRVRQAIPESAWRSRYDAINSFEKTLFRDGTIVIKFFLHISIEEQEQRLLDREKDPKKSYKLSTEDWKARSLWNEYTEANEEAISRCSSPEAPWLIVPSDKKWYRNYVVCKTVVQILRPYRKAWEDQLLAVGARKREELELYRASLAGKGHKKSK
ncbi:MAG: PPK2 family polyphosphate kinase [Planctomycetota bacterium]